MRRNTRQPKVGTLREIKHSHHNLYFHCARPSCRRGSKVPLDDLIAKYGAAFPVQALLERGVCQKCGARWPEIDCHLSPAPEAYAPRDYTVTPIKTASLLSDDRPPAGV